MDYKAGSGGGDDNEEDKYDYQPTTCILLY